MEGRATSDTLRERNRGAVLGVLRRRGALSHTDIAAETGLGSATVTSITRDLEREGVVERADTVPLSGRGRPRVMFRTSGSAAHAAIVRISAGTLELSLIDYRGTLLDRIARDRPSSSSGVPAFLGEIAEAIDRLLVRAELEPSQLAAVALTSKGLVEDGHPTLMWSPVFGDTRVDFREGLGRRFPSAEITLDNESLLVANALYRSMAAAGSARERSLAVLSAGHNIGLGMVAETADGLLDSHAPNFAHMPHHPGGALCRCGARGCIEAYAGHYAILRRALDVPETAPPASFVPPAEINKLAKAARQGNHRAAYAFREAGLALGNGIARLFSLHRRMPIVLTGAGMANADLVLPGIREGLQHALTIRLSGMPALDVVLEEDRLVFEGAVHKTLALIDRALVPGRPSASAIA